MRVKRHVDFLSTLYLTWGAIFTLVALAGFALAGGAAAIATAGGPVRIASEMAARLTAITHWRRLGDRADLGRAALVDRPVAAAAIARRHA